VQDFVWLGKNHPMLSVILTIPHSGELVPEAATWLKGVPPAVLLTDVDRFVHRLYQPAAEELHLPALMTLVHRYVADLNRYPGDVDVDSVEGAREPSGKFPLGFHWVRTTQGHPLIRQPISPALHQKLVVDYHDAFHAEFARRIAELHSRFGPTQTIYHLDCHSMPSQGTASHQDAGKKRPDVVISDFNGKSASPTFKDQVIAGFAKQGFDVGYNWPYQGGRITQRYGQPEHRHETIQIELNRRLYMDESSRAPLAEFEAVAGRIKQALADLLHQLGSQG
jgi:N-formylglutamate amidohydrolase